MHKSVNTLANGMYVKEHTFKSGTKVINLSVKCADFYEFMKQYKHVDRKGNAWLNLKLIPNKNVGDNNLTHTPILNEFTPKVADEAMNNLAQDVFKPSVEERQIVETPALPF